MRAIIANQHRVVVVVCDGLAMFEFGVACDLFGPEYGELLGIAWYASTVCAVRGWVLTDQGLRLQVAARLDALERADTVIVVPCEPSEAPPPQLLDGLRRAHARGARLVSLCTGAFTLAAAGLLDGRRATTHWQECARLAAGHPAIDVDPSVLYVDGGDILTSAGSAASIDLCLHLVAIDHGVEVANRVARQLVVPPHRPGGQAQYIEAPIPADDEADLFAETLEWAHAHLVEPITVAQLAARSAMSARTFSRRFIATTGTTPYRWLTGRRLRRAQELLETTDRPVQVVALDAGFPDVTTLRKHFRSVLRTTPSAYRSNFRAPP